MSSFPDGDAMKVLRTHSLHIEASQSANKSFDLTSDESQGFDSRETATAIHRDETQAWKRLQHNKNLHKLHFDLMEKYVTGQACGALTVECISRVST